MDPIKLAKRLQELATARSLIPPGLLAREPDLLTKKWFDYRFLSPLQSTLAFGLAYKQGIRAYARMHLDRDFAQRVNGVNVTVPATPSSMFTQLWTARQRADELGIPYEAFMEFSFYFAGRRQRQMAPTPLQLHANSNTALAWHIEFEKFKAGRPSFAVSPGTALPQYRIDYARGLPAQEDFRESLASAVCENPRNWPDVVARYHLAEFQLSKSAVLDLVPATVRDQAMEKAEVDYASGMFGTRSTHTLDDADFFQSCFGMQDAKAEGSAQCARCPDREECSFNTIMVDAATDRRFGSISPVLVARCSWCCPRGETSCKDSGTLQGRRVYITGSVQLEKCFACNACLTLSFFLSF